MTYCSMLVITVNPASLQSIISQELFETLIISEQDEVLLSKDQSFYFITRWSKAAVRSGSCYAILT